MEETPPPPRSSIQEDGNETSSSSLGEWNFSFPNPMENSVIVRLILDFCDNDVKSFESFASVSRVWHSATRPRWNALVGTLRLYPTDELRKNANKESMTKYDKILSVREFFLRATEKDNVLQKYPYSKYELRYWDLQPNHFGFENSANAAQPFFDAQSWFWASNRLNFITHLNMHHCKAHGSFTMYSEEFLRALPNLTFLKIIGANNSNEAMEEIRHRYVTKRDYYEHPNLYEVHLEPLLPLADARRALGVFDRSMTSMKCLHVHELREDDPAKVYKITDFTPGRFHDLHGLMKGRSLDTLVVVEYTSSNPEYRSFRDYPVNSSGGISSFPETFEVFSGYIQKKLVSNGGKKRKVFTLDMYACPFSSNPETMVCWDSRLNKISLWGGLACSLGFLERMPHLEELTYNISCFGNEVHRKKVLKFWKEDRGGTFRDNNPLGGGSQLEIEGDRILKWSGKTRFESFSLDPPIYGGSLHFRERRLRPRVGVSARQVNLRRRSFGSQRVFSYQPESERIIGKNLKKLDIDFRFGEASSWKRLGKAFPSVVDLKGIIQGDSQLEMIRNKWPGLTRLVVGHGSTGLSLEVILRALAGFAHLKEFEWKGCACMGLFGGPPTKLTIKQRRVEEILTEKGAVFTLPWSRKEEGQMEEICLEREFDDAMRTGIISDRNLNSLLSM